MLQIEQLPAPKAHVSAKTGTKRLYQRGAMLGNTRRGRRIRKLTLEYAAQLGGFDALDVADRT
jgi:hypothetical protein